MNHTEKGVRVYELGYWLVPTIPEDGLETRVAELQSVLTTHGATLISEEKPYLREMAYEMCRVISNQNHYFTEGYFGWIKFETTASEMTAIKSKLELDEDIVRMMIIQTVRENTVYTKRPQSLKRDEEATEVAEETVTEAPAEEKADAVTEAPATE
jgi:ribosomal protein S6